MGRQPENGILNKRAMAKINTAINKSLKEYCQSIYKEMSEAYDNVIYRDFYSQYKPHSIGYVMYHGRKIKTRKRTFSLYKASSGWHNRGIKKDIMQIEGGYEIHLRIGSDIMREHGVTGGSKNATYRADVDWVFNRSYAGIHGFTRKENDKLWHDDTRTKWWMPWEDYYMSKLPMFSRGGRPYGDYIAVPTDRVPLSPPITYYVESTKANRVTTRGLAKKMELEVRRIKKSLKNDKRFSEILNKNILK